MGGHSSTNLFNCHGYAWHVSERVLSNTSEYRWINEEQIYWEDTEHSYNCVDTLVEFPFVTDPPSYPGKISYMPIGREHSAVLANSDSFPSSSPNNVKLISKWADGPLMVHYPDYCPFYLYQIYGTLFLNVYHLNPKIYGETTTLCNSTQRTFTTDITNMPTGTLKWTPGPYLNASSADNTYQYTVRGPGSGSTYVKLETSTPSLYGSTRVRTWYGQKNFQVNSTLTD